MPFPRPAAVLALLQSAGPAHRFAREPTALLPVVPRPRPPSIGESVGRVRGPGLRLAWIARRFFEDAEVLIGDIRSMAELGGGARRAIDGDARLGDAMRVLSEVGSPASTGLVGKAAAEVAFEHSHETEPVFPSRASTKPRILVA